VSVDFLLGYTDIIENKSIDVTKDLGLSGDSIEMLKLFNDKNNSYYPLHKRCISALNTILSDFYNEIKSHAGNNNVYFGNVLYDIWEYIHADSFYTVDDNREKQKMISIYNDDEVKDYDFSRAFELKHVAKYRSQGQIMDKLNKLSLKFTERK
jgi:hypothetical protein